MACSRFRILYNKEESFITFSHINNSRSKTCSITFSELVGIYCFRLLQKEGLNEEFGMIVCNLRRSRRIWKELKSLIKSYETSDC